MSWGCRRPPTCRGRSPTLRGTTAEACRLPTFEYNWEYDQRFGGVPYEGESRANLAQLTASLQQLDDLVVEFEADAPPMRGPELLEAAKVTLRRIDRLEDGLVPLFAGLGYATFGRATRACIDARGRIGHVLDEAVVEGRL
ncbi:hypothetical protein ACPCG0_11420 [Propionibacteriaceae bacterium Y1923]